MAIWREDWENRDPKAGAMKHWVRTPLEAEIEAGRLKVILYKHVDEIREAEVKLTTETGESLTLPNDVVFVLVGSDADLTLLKKLGVKTEPGNWRKCRSTIRRLLKPMCVEYTSPGTSHTHVTSKLRSMSHVA